MRFGDRHADRVGKALAQRTGGDFDTRRVVILGMSGRLAAELAERFKVVEREIEPVKVQQRVQQRRPVSGAEDEAIAIEPVRIGRVEAQVVFPKRVRHRRSSER